MGRRITIDPITRLEGHGKIDIFLDAKGRVKRAYLQVPEFRGFEKFCEGRGAEEMPTLTQKICGVCPTAHHTAASKALDDLFRVEPPSAAKKIRELMYNAFVFEDHLLHFFFLGGPDFLVGPEAPRAERNILGIIGSLGVEIGKRVMDIRKRVRGVNAAISGSALYPVCGLPGGISKPLNEKERKEIQGVAKDAVAFALFALRLFEKEVLSKKKYADMVTGDLFYHRTYYMGLVDKKGKLNFYDGQIRVVDPKGKKFIQFKPRDYLKHLAERVEPWSYQKVPYLKKVGWKGYVEGEDSGIFRVGPLARLNASDGMATRLAEREAQKMFDAFGSKPVHHTLGYHWARLVEVLYAAERMEELAGDEELTSPKVRNLPRHIPTKGFGVCEAPRGTLFHHYETDKRGIVRKANLLVATQNNAGAISMSVEKAARALIKSGQVSPGTRNTIEVAFRAYDPCLACATHLLQSGKPGFVHIYNHQKELIEVL
jgi:F420-non-reducing hydrogenase large subunit